MPQPQKNQRLSLSFLIATYGEQVMEQLSGERDDSYAYVFPREAINILKGFDPASGLRVEGWASTVMDAFFEQAFPEAQQKPQIAQWVVKQYLNHRHNGKPVLAEDLHKIKENIEYFDSLKKSQPFKDSSASADLLSYKTYEAFEEMLQPFQQRRAERDAKADALFGLKPEQKKEILAETTILYEGAEGRVVVPHTPEASKFWGSQTRWCIAGREYAVTHFPHYNLKSPVIMILPKGHNDDKIALVDKTLYNSEDNIIPSLPELHRGLMQSCLDNLSAGARKNIAPWVPEEIFETYIPPEESQPDDLEMKEKVRREFANMHVGLGRDKALWNNREFVIAAMKEDGGRINLVHGKFMDDPEVMLAALGSWHNSFRYASRRLSTDREFMLKAIEVTPSALRFSSLDSDPEFMLSAIAQSGWPVMRECSFSLLDDRKFVLAAVKLEGKALRNAGKYNADRKIVLAAVSQTGMALTYASYQLQNDPEIVLAAVLQNPEALGDASQKLRADREIVFAAVTKNGMALRMAERVFRADREIVLAAVKQDGNALYYARGDLDADRNVVRTAVEQNAGALLYAAESLRENSRFVSSLLKSSEDLPFMIGALGTEERPIWQPDDAALARYQLQALEKILARGDTEKFFNYVRHMKITWGDPDMLFAVDPAATLAKIKAGMAVNQNVKRASRLVAAGM